MVGLGVSSMLINVTILLRLVYSSLVGPFAGILHPLRNGKSETINYFREEFNQQFHQILGVCEATETTGE